MLFGRETERSRIGELLDDARQARSGVLVVFGEPGVGKSALLEDARAQAEDMHVLAGSGVESEAHLPFAALQQLVRPVLGLLGQLPPPQAAALQAALGLTAGGGDDRFLVSLATLSLLAEASEQGPLLCLVDDAHWLDDASADALVFVARRLEAEGIVMLFAARESEARLFSAPGLPGLRLGGLDSVAAGALVDRHAGAALSPDVRERLLAEARGNPLALLELSSTLSEEQLSGTAPILTPISVSARVEAAFLARVRDLPEDAQTLLLVAAADDSGELATVLSAAARLGAGADALDAAEEAGLAQVRESRLEFRHPLVRSAVYQGTLLSRRQAAHRALASALAGDAEADRRAWHRAAATVRPDPAVVGELEQAAERARRRSAFSAASLAFERAASLTPEDSRRVRQLTAAAENAWLGGRGERAWGLLERARSLTSDPIALADIDRWRGIITLNVGVPADACALLVRAAEDVASVDAERALYMLALGTIAAAYGGDEEALAGIARIARRIGPGDTTLSSFLSSVVSGSGALFAGDFARGVPELRAALRLAEDADAAGSETFAELLIFGGTLGLILGDDGAAQRLNHRLVARAREAGALSLLTQAVPRLAISLVAVGKWSAAAIALDEALELTRQIGQHQVVAHLLALMSLTAALQGDEERARSLALESRELGSRAGLEHVGQWASWALAELDLARGRSGDALGHVRAITVASISLWSGLDRIEAAIRGGDQATARAWLDTYEGWAASTGAPWAQGVTLHCRALLANGDDAVTLFRAALDANNGSVRPFERARTELALGELLRRMRRRIEARDHLRAALEGFESLGASLWAERARLELRASGETARKRDPSTRGDLTPQELQIARLVGEGLSNREIAARLFLSPRTVDFHLRNIFRKLGLSSRSQLVRLELGADRALPPADQAVSPVRA